MFLFQSLTTANGQLTLYLFTILEMLRKCYEVRFRQIAFMIFFIKVTSSRLHNKVHV